jgi:GTP cyclohydrolase II
MIRLLAQGNLNTKFGEFTEYLFYDGQRESIALVKGDVAGAADILCRIHSHCLPAHVFNSIECDCREQMELAQERIETDGKGVIIWLDQGGKGNGHMAELLSAQLKADGVPQTEAYARLGYAKDARSFVRAAEIIAFLDIASVRLMTNNPEKTKALTDLGINVSSTQSIHVSPDNPELYQTYLDKVHNQGHLIDGFWQDPA